MVETFFTDGHLDMEMNKTSICLIPKRQHAKDLRDFRPISLCNVGYKIISKILTKRLKPLMKNLISETQSAFVSGRLITDNILIAHEMIHTLKSKYQIAEEFLAIKTDMAKAYDRIEWEFLKSAMKNLGFCPKWIELIMECVSTVTYKVLINGTAYGNITPTRGIRQGDPLSPFLFIMGTEFLAHLLKKAEFEGKLTGIKAAATAPPITHLLFADDSLFFCKANNQELNSLKTVLNHYCSVSGQMINFEKSSMIFGKRLSQPARVNAKYIMQIDKEGGEGLYLGLPEEFGKSKIKSLSYLNDRLQSRINSWQNKFLSFSGREVLLKAVAMALPTYTMSCFLLPQGICKQLRSVISNYWWKTNGTSKGIHWKNWSHMCLPKREGGLGFRDIKSFNLALLGKQGWRLMTDASSLFSKVFKSRYFKTTTFLEAKLGSRPSLAWRSIRASQGLLSNGLRKSIGSGNSTLLWKEPWLPTIPPRPPLKSQAPVVNVASLPEKVSELINHYNRTWNIEELRRNIHEDDIAHVLKLVPGSIAEKDGYTWEYNKSGFYSVKSGFWLHLHHSESLNTQSSSMNLNINPLFEEVWKTNTSPKIQNFLWRVLSNALPVNVNLKQKRITTDDRCPRCGSQPESVNHVIFTCPYAALTWTASGISGFSRQQITDSIYDNLAQLLFFSTDNEEIKKKIKQFPWIIWRLWKSRNNWIFNAINETSIQVLENAESDSLEWFESLTASASPASIQSNRLLNTINRWEAPALNSYRCDVDGAWRDSEEKCSVGWILRDWNGALICWGGKIFEKLQSPLQTEGEGLIWAMKSVLEKGFTNVSFHSDCLSLIDGLLGIRHWPSLNTIAQIYKRLSTSFITTSVHFNPRKFNAAADAIAKYAQRFTSYISIISSDLLEWLSPFVIADRPRTLRN